jgi:hypothetical protein
MVLSTGAAHTLAMNDDGNGNVAEAGAIEDVGRRFSDAVWATVHESLQKLGMSRESRVVSFPEIPNARGAIYQFDTDKYAHAVVATEGLPAHGGQTAFWREPPSCPRSRAGKTGEGAPWKENRAVLRAGPSRRCLR